MKQTLAVITALLTLYCLSAVAQTSDPQYVVGLGAGFSQYADPHYAATGIFGYRIEQGAYAIAALDTSTKYNPQTQRRDPYSVLRFGVEQIITHQGPLTLSSHVDAGVAAGAGNVTGSFSTGGTLAYSFAKLPNAAVFGSVRIIKAPQAAQANPGMVQTAFSFGVLFKFAR